MKNPSIGHLIVTCDLSDKMQDLLIHRFKEAGFMANNRNSFYTCSEEIEGELLSFQDEKTGGLHLKSYVANAEKLPFATDEFHSYTSNLVLNAVDNYHNQLKEAYRVVKDGGVAGFSVWGRIANCTYFTLIQQAIKQAGVELEEGIQHFSLGDKKD